MFGINSWNQVGQIAEGWAKDIVKAEQDLHDKRMKICKKCPLYTDDPVFHGKCDANKYINPKTGELSDLPAPGFIGGCGCALHKKSRVKDAKCVLNKW